jgi:hypothetical protein
LDFGPGGTDFIPQMALALNKKMVSQHEILQLSYALFFMDLVCWLGLLYEISPSFSILVSGLSLLYHNFY